MMDLFHMKGQLLAVKDSDGNGEIERFAYDKWNRLAKHTRGKTEETRGTFRMNAAPIE